MYRVQGLVPVPGTITPAGPNAVTPIPQVPTDVVDLIGNLRRIVLILDRAAILIQNAQAQVHLRNLRINWSVENPIAAADHRLVVS